MFIIALRFFLPGEVAQQGTVVQYLHAMAYRPDGRERDRWPGTVREPVVIGTQAPIPAGSTVAGVVTEAVLARKGNRAVLALAVRSVTVNGQTHSVSAPPGKDPQGM